MNTKIEGLLRFFANDAENPYISDLLTRFDRRKLKQVGICLLAWLRRYGNGLESTSRELNPNSPMDQPVYEFLKSGEMAELFELIGNKIDFRSAVPIVDRREMGRFVAENHRPEEKLNDG